MRIIDDTRHFRIFCLHGKCLRLHLDHLRDGSHLQAASELHARGRIERHAGIDAPLEAFLLGGNVVRAGWQIRQHITTKIISARS